MLSTATDSKAATSVKLAVGFLTYTAARTTEVRLATWMEIDLRSATRTIPAGLGHRAAGTDRTCSDRGAGAVCRYRSASGSWAGTHSGSRRRAGSVAGHNRGEDGGGVADGGG